MQNYEKVKVIGKGSFGAAWLVRRKADAKKLIAKEVQMAGMKPREKDEARNEVRLLSQLKHPNITQYCESFEHQASLYIVMEYADGGDLAGKIRNRKGKRMTEEDIMLHFVQICLALDYLHNKCHILHRDLKCQNVFLTSNGVIKLGDFGIATVLRHTMAMAHTVCGTPYYFSPELCQNKPYNNKSDIWALGCILYELSTLQHAFDGYNMKILMQKIVRGIYPPISSEYSKDLRDLIGKMLSREEHRRPGIGQVLQLTYVNGYACALGKQLGQGLVEKKSMVPEAEKQENRVHAQRRVQEQEAVLRAKRQNVQEQLRRREDAARKEAEEIIARRKKIEQDNQQHLRDKMEALRKQQEVKMRDAQKRAEVMDKERAEMREKAMKREEEEREKKRKIREEEMEKWRAKRKLEEKEAQAREAKMQAINKKREEQWDRQMEAEREERQAKDEMLEQMRAQQAEQEVQERQRVKMDEHERQKAAGRAYWEMRNAAAENKRKAEEDVARQRAENERAERQRAEQQQLQMAHQKAKPHTPTAEERRDAFVEMRREAQRNRERFEADLRGHAVPASSPSRENSPRSNSPPQQRAATPPRRQSPRELVERRASPIEEAPAPAPAPSPPAEEEPMAEDPDADLEHWLNDNAVAGEDAEGADEFEADYEGMVKHIEGLRTTTGAGAAPAPDAEFSDAELPQPMDILTAMSKFVLDGKTLNLPNVKAGDPLMYRIEALKMFLSEELGEERFLKVYRRLDGIGPDDSDAVLSDIGHLLGDKLALLQLVTQLIFCEDQFNIQQNQPQQGLLPA